MYNLDNVKMECTVGDKEFCFWQGKKTETVVMLLLTSGLAAFFCPRPLILPNSEISHVLKLSTFF